MNFLLTDQEIDDYFEQIIIPSFQPLVNCNLSAVIWKASGELLIATNKYAQGFGFASWQDMRGRNIQLPQKQMFPVLEETNEEKTRFAIDIVQQIINIRQQVLDTKIPVSAIIIHPFAKVFSTTIITYLIPIFHQSGEIIGVQMTINDFNMFGVNDYLSGYNDKSLDVPTIIKNSDELKIPLSRRQHEILFLLTIGLSQREAAAVLDISRSSIAKTLVESVCPKFGIYDANTNLLIDKARKMHLHKFIPSSLCKPWVIILGHEQNKNSNG